jgi:glutamyl-tRNA synthetase
MSRGNSKSGAKRIHVFQRSVGLCLINTINTYLCCQEIFSIEEMIELFDIADINQSAPSFNPEKLLWVNLQHIIAAAAKRLARDLVQYLNKAGLDYDNGPDPLDVAEGFRERAETLKQMAASARYCYESFEENNAKAAKKNLRPVFLEPLRVAREKFALLSVWSKEGIAAAIAYVATHFDINIDKLG